MTANFIALNGPEHNSEFCQILRSFYEVLINIPIEAIRHPFTKMDYDVPLQSSFRHAVTLTPQDISRLR